MILDKTATQEITQRGEEAITQLEQQFTENASQISIIQAEIADIRSAREDRSQALQRKTVLVTQLEDQFQQATSLAKLAQGTIREKECLSSVTKNRKRLTEAKQSLQELEAQSAEAEQKSQASEQELAITLQRLIVEQVRIQAELKGVQSAQSQAYEELGKERHAALLQAYREKQSSEDNLREQLISAQVEKRDILATALEEMAPWPELQNDIARLEPYEDAATRVIDASLFYLDTLLDDMQKLPRPWNTPLPSLKGGYHLLDAIVVSSDEIFRGLQDTRELKYRRDLVKKLQDEYSTHL